MSTKLYILLSGIIVSLTMVGLFVAASKLQDSKTHQSSQRSVNIIRNQPLQKTAREKNDSIDNQSLTILNMWYDLKPGTDTSGIRIDDDVKHARKVGIHTDLLAAIKPGYKVQLPSFFGESYLLKLGKVERLADSEMQIYGEIEDNNETYFSTISVIGNTLLAVLSTPNGDYDLKMVDGKGVIYQSEDLPASKAGSVVDLDSFLD